MADLQLGPLGESFFPNIAKPTEENRQIALEKLLLAEPATIESELLKDYGTLAQKYLDRDVFKGTPITGKMLEKSAKETYEKTGKLIPLELALAQAQFESSMGREGRSPQTNPYNVGEFDNKTTMTFDKTEDGVDAYYKLMANDYLNDKKPDELLKNFVNKNGHRYAKNPKYEAGLKTQIGYINRFLNK